MKLKYKIVQKFDKIVAKKGSKEVGCATREDCRELMNVLAHFIFSLKFLF